MRCSRFIPILITMLLMTLVSACGSIRYYSHLAKGQWSLLSQREPIDHLLERDDINGDLKERLQQVKAVREFASQELGLADNNSYRYYTDLKRPYAVWNVFAAPEFSTNPTQWCFPFAGCVSYRGYFNEQSARAFANQLAGQGLDIYVGGVAAYSTLGWFDDPVLNTFLYNDDTRLAGLIFHELAHQQLYLPGDTEFNESFARCVEIAGVKRWLKSNDQAGMIEQYLQRLSMQRDFVNTVLTLQADLTALYKQSLTETAMRDAKREVIETFQQQHYADFKVRWKGYAGYDRWVIGMTHGGGNGQPSKVGSVTNHYSALNNAKLNTIASYHRWLSAFEQLLLDVDGDFNVFYQQAEKLSTLTVEERREALERLDTHTY